MEFLQLAGKATLRLPLGESAFHFQGAKRELHRIERNVQVLYARLSHAQLSEIGKSAWVNSDSCQNVVNLAGHERKRNVRQTLERTERGISIAHEQRQNEERQNEEQ